ncbi:uroporphyrinogen decarboxylase family protein [Candidatus Latescibacterota bacterium]
MDGRERYIRALTFDGPDRVPVMHSTIHGARLTHGVALEDLYARYPSDVLGSFAFADNQRGGWADGAVTYDDWGCGWLWNTPEHMGQAVEHPLADWAALDDLQVPDAMSGEDGVDRMAAAVAADGHRHFVFVDGGEVFQRMIFLRGMEDLMVDLHEDRPEVYVLRDLIVEVCVKRIARWCQSGAVDGVMLRDDWGTQEALMIRPDTWRRVFRPAYQRLADAIHEGGAYASFHSDGAITAILPDMVEIGWDEVNPQLNVMDLADLVPLLSGKVCVRADIDRQYTMPYGTPDEVRQLVRRLYEAFGQNRGGFVGWGQMNSDVPLANGEAMLETLFDLTYE